MRNSCKGSLGRWSCSIARRSASRKLPARSPDIRWLCFSASTKPATSCRSTNGCWPTRTRSWCSAWTTYSPNRKPTPEEIDAIREWLKREGTCLLLAPHHDVGFTADLEAAADGIPSSRRRTRAPPAAFRTIHSFADEGARSAGPQSPMDCVRQSSKGTKEIAPLTAFRDLDKLGLLNERPTLNFHLHLPHYEMTEKNSKSVHLLARQPIDPDRPAPLHRGRQHGVQLPALDAAERAARRRHRARGLRQISPRSSVARTV